MASISRARKVSVMAMSPNARQAAACASLPHGGDLAAARRQFPNAPEPFIDLSTGINPHAYPAPQLPPELFTRLPQPAALDRLLAAAAQAFGAPCANHIMAAPGTQILLPAVASLVAPGRAAILGPTYAEHARVAALSGHSTQEVHDISQLAGADLAVVVNPNNPDGRLIASKSLLVLADTLRSRRGLLVVDEAFMDVAPVAASLAGEVARGNIVVLRSFGKFFGLAGLRLGFALAPPDITARLAEWFGPWAVAGPAIAIGEAALGDTAWAQAMRHLLERDARRLDETLSEAGLEILGGTSLFRLARAPAASVLFHHLGNAGIWVRRFTEQPTWLRFGLPGGEDAWMRLQAALAAFARS